MMTNFADFHLAIRRLVSGRGFLFVADVQSTEHHPGRIDVQWSACIIVAPGKPHIVARSISPSIVLESLEKQLQGAVPSLAPAALREVGAPLEPEPPVGVERAEPVRDLVNVKGAR